MVAIIPPTAWILELKDGMTLTIAVLMNLKTHRTQLQKVPICSTIKEDNESHTLNEIIIKVYAMFVV